MYESHFGFSGTPFNLNPDPAFYFQSKGHGNALSYLRFGVYQGEGFVVVTGEIGAGKTTLVRTLLSELDDQKIVAAQIVSTQLEAGDLLRSVAIAFGIAPKDLSKAELIASIEAFLTLLVTQNKRALLIVDEAQNLQLQAIEELRMLSNFQLGNHALLQSFLVGQPELRQLLTSKPMEQFRQRVIASCHLGPMDAAETQAYVEHRLRKVGWKGLPAFDAVAFERIHRWTSGTPRRVNLLCNRLLLAAYLASATAIDGAQVDEVAGDVLAEVGESKAHLAPMGEPFAADAPAAPTVLRIERSVRRIETPTHGPDAGPVLCVVATRTDDQKLAVLMQAIQRIPDAPPLALVRIGDASMYSANDDFHRQLGLEVPIVELDIRETSVAGRIAETIHGLEPVLDLHEPSAVVVVGCSDAALACAIVANKRACALVHAELSLGVEAKPRAGTNLAVLACLATGLEVSAPQGSARPGDLGADAVALARSAAVDAAAVLRQAGLPARAMLEKGGHALVDVDATVEAGDRRRLTSLLSDLREASGSIPLVWPMRRSTLARLEAFGLRAMLRNERIVILGPLGFAELVALVERSRCVLTDSVDLRAQAKLLDVPCLWMAPDHAVDVEGETPYSKAALEASIRATRVPPRPVGAPVAPAAARLATALVDWLTQPGGGTAATQRQLGR